MPPAPKRPEQKSRQPPRLTAAGRGFVCSGAHLVSLGGSRETARGGKVSLEELVPEAAGTRSRSWLPQVSDLRPKGRAFGC